MNVLNSYFWTATGVIYFLAVVLCIARKARGPKPTPPEVLEYEAWVRDQLTELYRERAERVEAAFAPRRLLTSVAAENMHRFAQWIQILPKGEVRVGDRAFHASEPFQAIARDDSNTDRAVVSAHGDGRLCIICDRVSYQAIWTGTEWRVEEIQSRQLEIGT